MPSIRILFAGALAAALCGPAVAGPQDRQGHGDGWPGPGKARVLHAEPIYRPVEVVVPERPCRPGYAGNQRDQVVATLVGGVVGGVLGSQVGKGGGRTAMTVAGTAFGALIGNRLADDDHRSRRRCTTLERVERRDELVGYRVKYRYRGRVYHTRTRHDPGEWIRVDHAARETRF